MPVPLLIPDWPVPPQVRAAYTSRSGGVSVAPYDSLNLGDHVGDVPTAVAANRAALAHALGHPTTSRSSDTTHPAVRAAAGVIDLATPTPIRPVFLTQVHGTTVERLSRFTPDGTQADACVTSEPGVACTIMVADCLAVLLARTDGSSVAAAHAGWRGLAGQAGKGVLESVVGEICPESRTSTAGSAMNVIAWLGPCIGPDAFEVGDEVRAVFVDHDASAAVFFRPQGVPGKWLADLPGLARQRLRALGVTQIFGNDGSPSWCTLSNPSRFFSHRRDRVSGRLAACVWRV